MHFIFEALRQRPLESKSLAIGRGITAILMGCCFLAYVGFLIYQICTDHTLILQTSKTIPESGYPAPDIEMCMGNSDFIVTSCVLVDMDYKENPLTNCTKYLTIHPLKDGQYCKAFQVNDSSVHFALKEPTSASSSSGALVRRVDFYWAVQNLTAAQLQQRSLPNLSITTYSQQFSAWRRTTNEMNDLPSPQADAWNSLQHQKYVSSSEINHSTQIYFKPSRYRYLQKDALSVIGLNNTYLEVDSIETTQLSWGMNYLNPNYDVYGHYQGHFGITLSTQTYLSMKEQRQHSVLSALGLTGGPMVLPQQCISFFSAMAPPQPGGHQDYIVNIIPNHHQTKETLTDGIDQVQSENGASSSSSTAPIAHHNSLLESRVEELEEILRDYFLNVEHLDRLRRRQQENHTLDHHLQLNLLPTMNFFPCEIVPPPCRQENQLLEMNGGIAPKLAFLSFFPPPRLCSLFMYYAAQKFKLCLTICHTLYFKSDLKLRI
ncbi:hypothetical protein BCR42DRAFT_490518 [Absidia repens]|uniref:Uncharacterized protein n=1 Tax=Absidia repens TaxID=90262 RepID=A0A1X2IJU0_9FUNG|nr:hypothetical protein BCR42DRAFT_490518 [Absidia repens]